MNCKRQHAHTHTHTHTRHTPTATIVGLPAKTGVGPPPCSRAPAYNIMTSRNSTPFLKQRTPQPSYYARRGIPILARCASTTRGGFSLHHTASSVSATPSGSGWGPRCAPGARHWCVGERRIGAPPTLTRTPPCRPRPCRAIHRTMPMRNHGRRGIAAPHRLQPSGPAQTLRACAARLPAPDATRRPRTPRVPAAPLLAHSRRAATGTALHTAAVCCNTERAREGREAAGPRNHDITGWVGAHVVPPYDPIVLARDVINPLRRRSSTK